MKITRIAVDGVGRFGVRTEVAGLGPGVNVLAAGNEAGKSTLFRAVRACLLERHSTRSESIRALATDGLSLPVTVRLDFEHAGVDYAVTKSFIKGAAASLVQAGVEIARDREADERLWDLLGVAPGRGHGVDDAAFGILWVGQGDSLKAPAPGAAAADMLNAVIEAEVGSLVGGERAQRVMSGLKSELALLVTDTGRPKAGRPLAEAKARLEQLEGELAESERRLTVLDGQLLQLAARRAERAQLVDPAFIQKTTADLEAAQDSLKAGESAAAMLNRFQASEQLAKAVLESAQRQLAEIHDRQARIDSDRARQAALHGETAPLLAQERAAQDTIRDLRAQITALNAEAEQAEQGERRLQNLAQAAARTNARDALARRLDALQAFARRQMANSAALAGNRVDARMLATLDNLERTIERLTARLEAAAPEVAIELGPSGAGQVLIDGAVLEADATRTAVAPLFIEAGGLARIRVTPSNQAGAAERTKLHDALRELALLLEAAGAPCAGDLRAARARREALEAEARDLCAELALMGIAGETPALEIERLSTELAASAALVEGTLAQMQLAALPSAAELESQAEGLRRIRAQARSRREALDGALDGQTEITRRITESLGRLNGALNEIGKRLSADLALLPDAGREAVIARGAAVLKDAQDDHRIKAAALEEQRSRAPAEEELERRKNQVQRLANTLEANRTRLGAIERDIANLEGQIQSAGGDGLGEQAQALGQSCEQARREVERHANRVEVLQLLQKTVEACYTEQRDRLQAPLRRYLKPFLNDVFPTAELDMGEEFSIAGMRRRGPGAEDFARLSAGTQEQIAVLVRLAMGAMICDRGGPVPIILDDALVFSDDERIEQMFDALNRAAQKQQVIVLTCRTRAFARLGGRPLSLETSGAG